MCYCRDAHAAIIWPVGPLTPAQDIGEPCSELVAAGPDLVASPSCRAAGELISAPTPRPVAVKEVGADRTHFEVMGHFASSQICGQARVWAWRRRGRHRQAKRWTCPNPSKAPAAMAGLDRAWIARWPHNDTYDERTLS